MKLINKLVICLLLVFALLGCGFAFADEDPITGEISIDPNVLASAGDVKVHIVVSNSGSEDFQDPVYLYSPQGKIVDDFGQGGYALLNAGQSITWDGTWYVSDNTLEDGKVVYYIMYTTYGDDGSSQPQKKPLSAAVTKGSPASGAQEGGLKVERVITPTVAQEGQEVTVKYILDNTGDSSLWDISIQENRTINKDKKTIDELPAGKKAAVTYTAKMGQKDLTSSAVITYATEKGGATNSFAINEAAITYGQPKLSASLVSSAKGVVRNGTVTLTLMLKNTGTVGYKNIRVTDPTLGELFSGESVGAGKTLELKKEVTVADSTDYAFTIQATDETGTDLTITTDPVSVTAINEEDALKLDIQVSADRTEVYETPGRVRFKIVIANTGKVDAKDAVLTHGDVTIAKLGDIKAGETKTLNRDTAITMTGRIRFTVKAIDTLGNTQTFAGNDIQIVISAPTAAPATSTPVPELTAIPTAFLATMPPVSADSVAPGAKAIHSAMLPVLIIFGLIGLSALVLVIAAKVRRAKNNKPSSNSLDQLETSGHRDYTSPSGESDAETHHTRSAAETPVDLKPVRNEPSVDVESFFHNTEEAKHAAPDEEVTARRRAVRPNDENND